MLEEIKPAEWVGKGASETYIDQHKSVQAEMGYLVRTAGDLKLKPESLTLTLQLFLRLQSIESLLHSLIEGVHRYQNPALAELLKSTMLDNDKHGIRLREYLVELVETKEAEFRIADEEAQRCRGALIRQPRSSRK
jgi:hypothetical protein